MKRTLSIIQKADPNFYESVGKHIIKWLEHNKATRQKPGTQKELCRMLEQHKTARITPSQLSRYIKGINKMPAKIENAITNTFGFASEYFVKHHARSEDRLSIEQLTKEDLFKLIHEQKLLIQSWKEYGFRNSDMFDKYINENSQLIKISHKLIEENDKLRAEARAFRKELKNAD